MWRMWRHCRMKTSCNGDTNSSEIRLMYCLWQIMLRCWIWQQELTLLILTEVWDVSQDHSWVLFCMQKLIHSKLHPEAASQNMWKRREAEPQRELWTEIVWQSRLMIWDNKLPWSEERPWESAVPASYNIFRNLEHILSLNRDSQAPIYYSQASIYLQVKTWKCRMWILARRKPHTLSWVSKSKFNMDICL